jgi:hypothetical protein
MTCTETATDQLQRDAIEHAMRVSSDEAAVAKVAADNQTKAAREGALGTLLGSATVALLAGSPLMAWCTDGKVDPQWRRCYPPVPHSLYEVLVGMREFSADEGDQATYHSLLDELRTRRLYLDALLQAR